MNAKFNQWIDTFVEEKGLDLNHEFEVEGPEWGTNYIPLSALVETMKAAPDNEQEAIRKSVIYIDFNNGDVMDFFEHLAQAIAL